MKKRFVLVVLLAVLCSGVFLVRSCYSGGRRFVDRAMSYTHWSEDSRYLFYSKSEKKLFRYDVKTQKLQTYSMPDRLDQFAISQDGQSVAFPMVRSDVYSIFAMDLSTGNVRTIYSMKDAIDDVHKYWSMDTKRMEKSYGLRKGILGIAWLPHDQILLLLDAGKGVKDISLVDLSRGSARTIKSEVADLIGASSDGAVLIYEDVDALMHLYDLATKQDKPLGIHGSLKDRKMDGFIYLSKRQAIYLREGPKQLDLTTLQSTPIHLPETENISGFSPDLTKCLTGSSSRPSAMHGGWVSNTVYVTDLPKETTRKLRRINDQVVSDR